ncbi:MAG: hypothetical protein HFI29_11990 [Lachnospiraceae bacterium]|jgi:hypothetical protein|nr:hypothetical protein [Lachnospiraceae bacterium]
MGKFDKLFWLDTKLFDLAGLAIQVKRLPYYILNKDVIKRNIEIKKEKTSSTCYILGLGPSLKNVDLRKIDGDVITVNSFCRIKQDIIKPKVYCIMDDIDYLSDDSTIIQDATRMYPDAFFVLNGKYKKEAQKRIQGKVKSGYLFAWGGYFKSDKPIDICKITPIMGNIVCYAIYLAMFMGYKRIILLGCDFNSFTSRKELHCYQDDSDKTLSLSYELFCYSFCADTHYQLFNYARKHGIRIENATEGSLIDAYPSDKKQTNYYIK